MKNINPKVWNLPIVGGRRYSAPQGSADVWDEDWNFIVNRADAFAVVQAAFRAAGFDDVLNIENGTADTTGGWLYTVDSIPGYAGDFPEGASRMLCVETNPRELEPGLWQSDPSIQFWAEPGAEGNVPPNVWFQFWQYNNRFGTQLSTFDVRDKTQYVSNSDPLYPSTDYPWFGLQGAGGFNFSPPPNNIDNYLALEAERAQVPYDPGADPVGYKKIFQNLTTAVKILPNEMWQARIHIDTSGAEGLVEMWLRPRGGSFTKVMEWLPGVTQYDPGVGGLQTFQWPTSVNDRTGAKQMRWPSTTNGEGNHAYRYFGRLQIATDVNNLSVGD